MAESECVEFPVIIDESNEVITLILDKQSAEKANQDEEFLRSIITQYRQNAEGFAGLSPVTQIEGLKESEQSEEPDVIDQSSNSKSFVWPDAAVFLLIELYREKQHEFNSGTKRHNVIWRDIAVEMKNKYPVTGLQCSTKLAGLRRTYKNIYDQNKKSGNSHSSWAFYSVMDSLIGDKAYIKPLAEASSEGPTSPIESKPSSSRSFEDLRAPKKRRVETVLENYIDSIREERKNIIKQQNEENKEREKKKEEKYEERKKERERMHNENLEIQKSLLAVLQTFANKS